MRYALHPKSGGCRALLLMGGLVLSSALGGCSSDGSTDFRSLTSIIRLAFAPPQKVTIKQASAIPYATIGVRLGGGPQAIGTLATDDGAQRLWAIGAKIMIVTTRDGQIQRTVGLPFNLSWMTPTGPAATAAAPGTRRRTSWSADFTDLAIYSATIQCEEIAFGNVRIPILGKLITTRRSNVRCEAPQLKWTFQNTYWTDPQTGLVWKSIQYVHPKLDSIEIETLRPPS
jgi:hypothetical protein